MCQNTTMRVYGAWIKPYYIQKHIGPKAVGYNLPLVHDKPLGVAAFVKLVYWKQYWQWKWIWKRCLNNVDKLFSCLVVLIQPASIHFSEGKYGFHITDNNGKHISSDKSTLWWYLMRTMASQITSLKIVYSDFVPCELAIPSWDRVFNIWAWKFKVKVT